ncbi:SH3 domain-containing protein 2 [Linum perenne]
MIIRIIIGISIGIGITSTSTAFATLCNMPQNGQRTYLCSPNNKGALHPQFLDAILDMEKFLVNTVSNQSSLSFYEPKNYTGVGTLYGYGECFNNQSSEDCIACLADAIYGIRMSCQPGCVGAQYVVVPHDANATCCMRLGFVLALQAVLKQFGASGYGGSDGVVTDEGEFHQHQKLEKLYISTRAGKHFQRDIVRGVEGYIVTGSKQVEIGTKLSEDSRKYGSENTCTSGNTLSKAALNYGRARAQMEKERGSLLKAFGTQVAEPLRAMVMGAPLEDARHLAQRYDRMRQETEAQAIEVSKRQAKAREMPGHPEVTMKWEAAEAKLQDLKANMDILGKEASAAMAAVEAQQQRLTLQRLIAMVEAERNYHQRVLQILDQLESEMISERQRIEAPPTPVENNNMPPPPPYEEVNGVHATQPQNGATDSMGYFLGEVLNPYNAETDVELSLSVGDYVVVRKVTNNGWAEGECKGKAGWFPFGYIERRDRVLASKIAEVF